MCGPAPRHACHQRSRANIPISTDTPGPTLENTVGHTRALTAVLNRYTTTRGVEAVEGEVAKGACPPACHRNDHEQAMTRSVPLRGRSSGCA
jgi:hypothetical protein